MFKKKNKDANKEQQQQELAVQKAKQTVNSWLPFLAFEDNLVRTKDDRLLAYIQVDPININLKSDNETERIISSLHECFNGKREGFQIECIQRPQDLDGYIREISELHQNETDLVYKKLLAEYQRYVSGLIASGQAMEKQFYIILSKNYAKGAKDELIRYAEEFCQELSKATLYSKVLSSSDVLNYYYTFYNPATAAFERPQVVPGFSVS